MGKSKANQISFSLEGRFLRFIGERKDKPKRLHLATAEGEYSIKLAKKLRTSLKVIPGDWVQVSGKKKLSRGQLKLKASRVYSAPPKYADFPQPTAQLTGAKARVMVCQKSPCLKRGAGLVCQALEIALGDRGLEDQVSLKTTGCMNRCKAGPNVVFMPGKNRYSGIPPEEISALVEKHFPPQ